MEQEKEATWGRLPRHTVSTTRTGLASVGVVISQGVLQHRINREVLQRKLLMPPLPDGGPSPQSVQFEEESIISLSSLSNQSQLALNIPPSSAPDSLFPSSAPGGPPSSKPGNLHSPMAPPISTPKQAAVCPHGSSVKNKKKKGKKRRLVWRPLRLSIQPRWRK